MILQARLLFSTAVVRRSTGFDLSPSRTMDHCLEKNLSNGSKYFVTKRAVRGQLWFHGALLRSLSCVEITTLVQQTLSISGSNPPPIVNYTA